MPDWLITLLGWIGLKTLWQAVKRSWSWLKPQGLLRDRPLTLAIGESAYIASPPYTDEREVKDIICQVILGNPSNKTKAITTFRLEIKSKAPYPLSEARDSERGGSF